MLRKIVLRTGSMGTREHGRKEYFFVEFIYTTDDPGVITLRLTNDPETRNVPSEVVLRTFPCNLFHPLVADGQPTRDGHVHAFRNRTKPSRVSISLKAPRENYSEFVINNISLRRLRRFQKRVDGRTSLHFAPASIEVKPPQAKS
jgi:hypothetical protein